MSAEFPCNSTRLGELGRDLFELGLGWTPKSRLDLLHGNNDDVNESDSKFKTALRKLFQDAKCS